MSDTNTDTNKNIFSFPVTTHHEPERISDLLINANETGATSYWCAIVVRHNFDDADGMYDVERDDFHWSVVDHGDDGETYHINQAQVLMGLMKFAHNAPRHYADWIKENDDCITCDVFLQYIVFGEIKYS